MYTVSVVCLELVNIALDNSLSTLHDFDLNLDLGDVDSHPLSIVRFMMLNIMLNCSPISS